MPEKLNLNCFFLKVKSAHISFTFLFLSFWIRMRELFRFKGMSLCILAITCSVVYMQQERASLLLDAFKCQQLVINQTEHSNPCFFYFFFLIVHKKLAYS